MKGVHLMPLMLVVSDHAINDMASDEEDSRKTLFNAAGITATPWLNGLGENPAVRNVRRSPAAGAEPGNGGGGMSGKLYALSTGPGAADLITVRAARVLGTLDILYAPAGRKGGDSLALSIVREYIGERTEVRCCHFPDERRQRGKRGGVG